MILGNLKNHNLIKRTIFAKTLGLVLRGGSGNSFLYIFFLVFESLAKKNFNYIMICSIKGFIGFVPKLHCTFTYTYTLSLKIELSHEKEVK